ncbi:kinase-like protein [Mytilinidion resinicola]|uniref:Kinase-like protein n=1 Tax=Mytilinidion resinicola TaxID=574789 RepID=A0A6A6Z0S6_9PEZI|nr:kinase-like protein [Mytilinidion resinicola]KAF2814398.1 kinase-like protein [Mytilinidion resinicola]
MYRRNSGSDGEIGERSVASKAKVFSRPQSNAYVDSSFRRPSISQSPRPFNGIPERYRSRSRSRSPYRHPTTPREEPRGEKRPRDNYTYREDDRVDNRRFKVHYDDAGRYPQPNGRSQISYADLDYGGSGNMRGGRDNYRKNNSGRRSRSPGRQNRGGRGAGNRDRSDRRGRGGQHDKYSQGNFGKNGYRGRGGYANAQNGGGFHRNSREPSMGREGHNGWQNSGSRRNSRDLSVSNQGDPQQYAQNFRSSAENRPRDSQQETAQSTARKVHANGVEVNQPTHDSKSAPPTIQPPEDQDIDYDNLVPVDEDAEIARRRAKREAIKARAAAKNPELPLLQQVLIGSASSPNSPAISTPVDESDRSVSPATPGAGNLGEANATDSPAVVVVNKADDSTREAEEYRPLGEDDGPSAANYDPTMDQEKDRLRAEQKAREEDAEKLGHQKVDDSHDVNPTKNSEDDFDMFADTDDEDMFAAETPVKLRRSSSDAGKPLVLGEKMMSKWVDADNYYVIRNGELMNGRYVVEQELGKGMFSGVIRARDLQTNGMVAIKIIRKNDTMKNIGQKEIQFLEKVNAADPSDRKHVVRYYGQFDHKKHLCLIFENLDMNVRDVLKKYGGSAGLTWEAVKAFARQIFIGLDFLHKQDLIHADFKPDNLLVDQTHKVLKICDLGSACEPHETHDLSDYLVSRFYRAPEVILQGSVTSAIDIWAAGCTMFELWTGDILFRGDSNNQMLRAIMEVRGKFAPKLLRKGKISGKHFNGDGSFVSVVKDPNNPGKVAPPNPSIAVHTSHFKQVVSKTLVFNKPHETRALRYTVKAAAAGLQNPPDPKEIALFIDLLERCLDLKWEKRISAADVLKHAWFLKR